MLSVLPALAQSWLLICMSIIMERGQPQKADTVISIHKLKAATTAYLEVVVALQHIC